MTFLFSFVTIMTVIAALFKAWQEAESRSRYGLSKSKVKELSWAGKQIVSNFRSLPADNRPYGNIHEIVRALDVKHGKSEVNNHFSERVYRNGDKVTVPTWQCRCYRGCEMKEYSDLYNSILKVGKSVEEQAQALRVAAVSGGLSDAKELVQRLKDEAQLVNDITKQLMEH